MRISGHALLLSALLGAAIVASSCTDASSVVHAAVKPEKDRKAAPDFTLKDSNGASVKLSDYKGKVFAVVGVSMDEDGWSVVKPYIQERKVNYRILLGTEMLSQLYGGLDALPSTFLIDRTGRIASVHIGLSSGKDGFVNEIDSLLAAPRADLRRPLPLAAAV